MTRSTLSTLFLVVVLCPCQVFAVSNRHRDFPQPCDAVWTAAMSVAKTQEYRIVAISEKEQIISLIAGGAWWGERMISLSLATGTERGCRATVQSRFSGLAHSDGPDLLSRIGVELLAQTTDRNSKPFQHYKRCIDGYNASEEKCEAKLQKELNAASAKEQQQKSDDRSKNWWKPSS